MANIYTGFCLDIADNVVTGVLIDCSSKIGVVTGWGLVEMDGISLEDAVTQVCKQAGFAGGACRLSLGGEFFSFRNLSLPFSDRKKIIQILPFELENLSATEIESTQVDFLLSGAGPEGTSVVAAAIEKETLAALLVTLKKAGVDPDTVEIRGVRIGIRLAASLSEDCILLDICSSRTGLIIISGGQIALLRSLQFDPTVTRSSRRFEELGLLVKQTLLASKIVNVEKKNFIICLIGDKDQQQATDQLTLQLGVEVRKYELSRQPFIRIKQDENLEYCSRLMDPVLALAFNFKVKNKTFNFRKDEYKKKKSSYELRMVFLRASIPAALLLALIITYFGYNYKKMSGQQEALGQQIVQVFRETLPEVKRVVNPVQQLQVKINEIRKTYSGQKGGTGYGVLALLTEISARIPASYPIVIKRFVADSDIVRIKAVTGDFNTVDNIQKELEKGAFFQTVTISSASQSPKGEEVRFELKLELLQ